MLTRPTMQVRVTSRGEVHLTLALPPSLTLLPVPEAFREIEHVLSDAQDCLEAAVLGEPRALVVVEPERKMQRAG